jgi:hypothetical protein
VAALAFVQLWSHFCRLSHQQHQAINTGLNAFSSYAWRLGDPLASFNTFCVFVRCCSTLSKAISCEMSFGWSAGDIISAIALVNRIIKCVGNAGGAQEQFQELESELDGLLRALKDIKEVTSLPDQVPEIVALKFAACLCEETLKRFYEKIKPFDESLGVSSRKSKVKAAPRMVRWELLVKKDIPELRTYLVAHVGSLSLRLNTALL